MPDDFHTVGINQPQSDASSGGSSTLSTSEKPLLTELVDRMHAAALSPTHGDCHDAITFGLSKGIGPDVIADIYIPAVARIMGEKWCADQIGFAHVTIGVARLQGMLRDLGPAWSGDTIAGPQSPVILLIVGRDTHHTLGAMVLAGQLRRKGMSVRLLVGADASTITTALQKSDYDAIFISASCGDSLETLRRSVALIRTSVTKPTNVVVGGTLLSTTPDILELSGADFASNDPNEAMALCGLDVTRSAKPATVQGR